MKHVVNCMGCPMSKIVIMAGGTGGHIYPGLAVAEKCREKGMDVHWLGAKNQMETRIVPEYDIPLNVISVSKIRGQGIKKCLVPFQLTQAIFAAMGQLRRLKPGVVLGMGGFVSGPGGIAAKLLGIPLVVHEQNAVAGMTNRYLAKMASRVLQAFPNTFPAKDTVYYTGNPVRQDILQLPTPAERFQERNGNIRLLILGGSLGAQALNKLLPEALCLTQDKIELWHQTGKGRLEETKAYYQQQGVQGRLEEYIKDMAGAYAWADLVICRAGALTISEVMAAGLGAVFVPFPHAVDDHQTKNAQNMVEAQAAMCFQQNQLTPVVLWQAIDGMIRDGRGNLLTMAQRARSLCRTHACEEIVAHCGEVCRD